MSDADSSNQLAITLLKELTGQEAILVIPRLFLRLCDGDHAAALLLNQIIYWSQRTDNPDGWFYKTAADWDDELCLSAAQVRRAINGDKRYKDGFSGLKSLGIETDVRKLPSGRTATHYRVNWPTLLKVLKDNKPQPIINTDDPVYGQLFTAVTEHIFEIDANDIPNGTPGRIGTIAAWLAGLNDYVLLGRKKHPVGFISHPATAQQIKTFADYYRAEKPGLALPLNGEAFVTAWRQWARKKRQNGDGKKPAPAAPAPLTPEELARKAQSLGVIRPSLKEAQNG